MGPSIGETVKSLLEAVLDDLDNAEQRFRLRTTLQLLVALEAQSDITGIRLEGATSSPGSESGSKSWTTSIDPDARRDPGGFFSAG